MTNYRKGYYLEYKIKKILEKKGFWTTRIPKSGKKPESPIDILAIKNGKVIGFECKRRNNKFYLKELDIDCIKKWIQKTNGEFFLAIQFNKERKIRLYDINDLEKFLTNGKNSIDVNDKEYKILDEILN